MMGRSVKLLFWVAPFLILLFPSFLLGQVARGASDNSPDTVNLTVQVRTQSGSLLDKSAVVTLCTFAGQPMNSKTTIGAQAVFDGLRGGSYVVNVQADGYELASAQADLTNTKVTQVLIVKLKPDHGPNVSAQAPTGIVLAPNVQKEMKKGYDALRSGDLDESIKHLESAHSTAPNSADVEYLLGVVYEKKGDPASARKFWDEALLNDRRHLPSLLAYGDLLIRENQPSEAQNYLQRAVDGAPKSWQAHNLLALALLSQHEVGEAIAQSELAVKLGKELAAPALLTLGQALAADHQNERAINSLEAYLVQRPTDPQSAAVRALIAHLRSGSGAAGDQGKAYAPPR